MSENIVPRLAYAGSKLQASGECDCSFTFLPVLGSSQHLRYLLRPSRFLGYIKHGADRADMDTGDGAIQSWRVAQVLTETIQYDSDGWLIIRLKHHMPKEVLDEIGNGVERVEAVTKLANMACDGPLKDCRNADERLERAKKFLPTAEGETWSKQSCYA